MVSALIVQSSLGISTFRCPCGFWFILTVIVAVTPSPVKVVVPWITLHRKRQRKCSVCVCVCVCCYLHRHCRSLDYFGLFVFNATVTSWTKKNFLDCGSNLRRLFSRTINLSMNVLGLLYQSSTSIIKADTLYVKLCVHSEILKDKICIWRWNLSMSYRRPHDPL